MPLLQEDVLRSRGAYDARVKGKSATQLLRDSHRRDHYDIFLSHSFLDAELILGIKLLLEDLGYTVYVDWIDDPQLSRDHITKATAETLRRRMQMCTSMLYAATDNAPSSKWMPWELGYFDGLRKGKIAVLPLAKSSIGGFKGQEYLDLYPHFQIEPRDTGYTLVRKLDSVTSSYTYAPRVQPINEWIGAAHTHRTTYNYRRY